MAEQLPWLNADMLPDHPVQVRIELVRIGNNKEKYYFDVSIEGSDQQYTISSATDGVFAHQVLRQLEGSTLTIHRVKEKFINVWTQDTADGKTPERVKSVHSDPPQAKSRVNPVWAKK